MSTPSLFSDRLVNISITGPLVRLDFATLVAPVKEGQQPALTQNQTMVMPMDGFLQSFGMLEVMVRKLIAEGVLKPQLATSGAEPEPVKPEQ